MLKQESSTQYGFGFAKAAVIVLALALGACREQSRPPDPGPADAAHAENAQRTREQAMSALMALPELKAWSRQLEQSSGGKVHGALMEYDSQPRVIGGRRYWQFSFVENGGDAVHPWDSFLVAQDNDEILVEDFGTDRTLTLQQWRNEKKPMERAAADR